MNRSLFPREKIRSNEFSLSTEGPSSLFDCLLACTVVHRHTYRMAASEVGNLSSKALCKLLFSANQCFSNLANEIILDATISFILSAKRMECAH